MTGRRVSFSRTNTLPRDGAVLPSRLASARQGSQRSQGGTSGAGVHSLGAYTTSSRQPPPTKLCPARSPPTPQPPPHRRRSHRRLAVPCGAANRAHALSRRPLSRRPARSATGPEARLGLGDRAASAVNRRHQLGRDHTSRGRVADGVPVCFAGAPPPNKRFVFSFLYSANDRIVCLLSSSASSSTSSAVVVNGFPLS